MNLLKNGNQGKIREVIDKFRNNRKIIDIQRNFLKRLMMSKAGLVVISVNKWKALPQRLDKGRNVRANKFEAGLKRFIDGTLSRAIGSFKNQFDNGQAAKKRAVIQLIDVTMGGQKKFYQRWISIS